MLSIKRRGAACLAAAVAASSLVAAGAIATAGTAAADGTPPAHGGATGTLGKLDYYHEGISHAAGGDRRVAMGLMELAVDGGGTLQAYCIDIHNPTQGNAKYQEVPWSASSLHNNGDAGKIRWILQNSYPHVNDLASLAAKAGVDKLSENTAVAGTQIAIWNFSDHIKVDADKPDAEEANKLADYLEKNAQDMGEPKPSLTLDPPVVSGNSGGKLGPVTVHTNAHNVTIAPAAGAPAGVKVVGKDGKPVTSATNNTELFFDVPKGAADGSTSLTAQAATKVPIGRAFAGIGEYAKSQTLILAGSSEAAVSATASASWKKPSTGGTTPSPQPSQASAGGSGGTTPSPQPSPASAGGSTTGEQGGNLAETGSSSATPIIAGLAIVLVTIGGASVLFLRKKKVGSPAR
ncbi:Cys-Gln thioester bond-forming surface protein [Streptomyces kronopolitis]|uniref:Cys-Gln thioester bond-forming surface protein n=1 Tax=Streptomyces kronopolitis TaxID=1612435 RepID=UPI00369A60FC